MGRSPESVAWAESGALALTGRPDGPPLLAPDGVVRRAEALGRHLGVDVLALLAERAAIAGFGRAGEATCGGSGRLLPAADDWIAVNLPRPDDRDLIPAWLQVTPGPDVWASIAPAVRSRGGAELSEAAWALGLAVAAVGEAAGTEQGEATGSDQDELVRPLRVGDAPTRRRAPLVVDLSSLWAGPLCARLLRERGAQVVKVESPGRPDGARRGPIAFFQLMHAGARFVSLDLARASGREALQALVAAADVVIEASRPRALRQLGLEAEAMLTGPGPSVWISITGYGRETDRVAFGDDAAAAGGLVAWDEKGPCFAVDAVADPLTGVVAAAAATNSLAEGGRWLLDVSMSRVAAHVIGPDTGRRWSAGHQPTPILSRPMSREGAPPRPAGADNAAVAAELGILIP